MIERNETHKHNNPSHLRDDFARCCVLCELQTGMGFWLASERKTIVTRRRVMGQVYITVVAIMFLMIIKWVSKQMKLDKHIRTGILRESECLVQLRLGVDANRQHVTNTWYDFPDGSRPEARDQTVLYGHLNWYSGTFRPHSPLSK